MNALDGIVPPAAVFRPSLEKPLAVFRTTSEKQRASFVSIVVGRLDLPTAVAVVNAAIGRLRETGLAWKAQDGRVFLRSCSPHGNRQRAAIATLRDRKTRLVGVAVRFMDGAECAPLLAALGRTMPTSLQAHYNRFDGVCHPVNTPFHPAWLFQARGVSFAPGQSTCPVCVTVRPLSHLSRSLLR